MSFLVEYGIYVNCSISETREAEIEADDEQEAKTIAMEKADEMERQLAKKHPQDDIWVHPEQIIKENEQ